MCPKIIHYNYTDCIDELIDGSAFVELSEADVRSNGQVKRIIRLVNSMTSDKVSLL